MVTPIIEHYQSAYNKLYGFLRVNHPEILKEYRERLKRAKEKAEALILLSEEKKDNGEV